MQKTRSTKTRPSKPVRADAEAPMTKAQAARLKSLSKEAFEPDAFKPELTRAEAELRIKSLSAKLRLLDEPPHTL
jgi:hypothetical protein